jgi:thiol-disulfide isomerase/thioredoxin
MANRTIVVQGLDKPVLYGRCTEEGLRGELCADWFVLNYEAFTPDFMVLSGKSGGSYAELRVKCVLGTWCGDSRREVPRMLRLLKEWGLPGGNLLMFGVDRQKKAPDLDVAALGVTHVPTFIFYRLDRELGRIVERPVVGLEADMANILKNY